jgi:hypothetical protein
MAGGAIADATDPRNRNRALRRQNDVAFAVKQFVQDGKFEFIREAAGTGLGVRYD